MRYNASMQTAYKYRIYPNRSQRELIERTFGCCRWVYNQSLEVRTKTWEGESRSVTASECMKMIPGWKNENPWLADADAVALQQAVRDCDRAFQGFFRRCKQGGKPGYPRFKSAKTVRQSYRTQNPAGRSKIEVFEAENRVKLPKLGKVKAKISRPIAGRITSATISRDPAGRYHVSICCDDVPAEPLPASDGAVGVDLGIESLATLSTGEKVANPRALKKHERKLAREQRRLSRKQKGSSNRKKQQRKVARVHAKIADARNDYAHKLTTRLVRENQVIAAESLNVAGMVKNRHLAKHVADAGFGEVCRQLAYKAERHGRAFVQVGAWYPSSKACSSCGRVVGSMPLAVRSWECPACGAAHDRDVNAAKNILAEGLRILSELGTAGHAGTVGHSPKTLLEQA